MSKDVKEIVDKNHIKINRLLISDNNYLTYEYNTYLKIY